jgi:hypothetical protein
MERLNADREWLSGQGTRLSQWGPDPHSGKVTVYLARFTEAARQLLAGRYGSAIVVDTESRQWRAIVPPPSRRAADQEEVARQEALT